jgi:hypothetical protein
MFRLFRANTRRYLATSRGNLNIENIRMHEEEMTIQHAATSRAPWTPPVLTRRRAEDATAGGFDHNDFMFCLGCS